MSHKVTTLVYSRVAGSAVRKGVLSYMADRANDDGSGVWCSKQTIADETEFGRSTIIRTCNEFVSEGLITPTGTRKCANGATVEYTLNLDAISRLPKPEKKGKASQSGTSPDIDPSQSGTPPVPERDPKASQSGTQTILEPPMNLEAKASLSFADEVRLAFDAYNATAKSQGWPIAKLLSKPRITGIKARLKDLGGIEGWNDAISKARASPFCNGANNRNWVADLDFLIQQKSMIKLMEGSYDERSNRNQTTGNGSGRGSNISGPSDGFAALAERYANQ